MLPELTRAREWNPTLPVPRGLTYPQDSSGAVFSMQGSWLLMERDKLVISRRVSGWSRFAHLPVTSTHTCHRVSEVGGEL